MAPQTNAEVASPQSLPGMTTHVIDVQGRHFQLFLILQLSFLNVLRLLFNMLIGRRPDAIRIVGKNVMAKRGLNQLGKDTLDTSGQTIGEVMHIVTNEFKHSRPILMHCTHGKDRTGLIVLMLLLLLGGVVEEGWIQGDYMISEAELLLEREKRVEEIVDMGMPESFAYCQRDFAQEMIGHLQARYGGVEGYLTQPSVGLRKDEIETIKRTLLG